MAYKKLYVNGRDLFTYYGVYISGQGVFGAPERDYTFYDVKGRDGDLVSLKTKLKNMTVSYKCGIVNNFDTNLAGLRAFLLTRIGYVKINDDYHPNEYRMGVYTGPLEPSVSDTNDSGEFTLTFNCKPQRWLDSGDTFNVFTSFPATITNPTLFDSKPFIRVTGSGTIRFGVVSGREWYLSIATNSLTYVDIDCETMEAYDNAGNNKLSLITCSDDTVSNVADFPLLTANKTTNISVFTGSFSSVRIKPRWWSV